MTEQTPKAKALDLLYDYAHAYADVSHQHQALGDLIAAREGIRHALQNAEKVEGLEKAIEKLHEDKKLVTGKYDYQCGFLDALNLVKEAFKAG